MSKLDLVNGWSCDERNRSACRNPHGCHCREITALRVQADTETEGELVATQYELAATRAALAPFAKISLWRDQYPDAKEDRLTARQLQGYIKVDDVRRAREALALTRPLCATPSVPDASAPVPGRRE